MDKILERLIDQTYYFFLDGYSWHNQIDENQKDQENTIFIFSFDVFAYRRMSLGICNTPTIFERRMFSIFSDMIKNL